MIPHPKATLSVIQIAFILLAVGCQVSIPRTLEPMLTEPTPKISSTNNISVATATLAPTMSPCLEKKGEILEEKIDTEFLAWPLEFVVYLPPCYSKTAQQAYPVLYILHGQGNKYDQWLRLGLLDAADELITAGVIAPLIIVMPYEVTWSVGPEQSKFGEGLLSGLFPYIEENYHACYQKKCRMIGGLSRGGNWAVNLAFAHPELFTAVGSHSAPLFYGEINRINSIMSNGTATDQLPRFYLDAGNKDENLAQVQVFVALLKEYNIPYVYTQFTGYHNEDYWRTHVRDYLTWYSGQVLPTP